METKAKKEKQKSYYPLCRLLQEATGKPLSELADACGMSRVALWDACRRGRVSFKTLYVLLKVGVPLNTLEEYVDTALKMKAEKIKNRLREVANAVEGV